MTMKDKEKRRALTANELKAIKDRLLLRKEALWEEIEMKPKSASEFFGHWRYTGKCEIQFSDIENRKAHKLIARFALGSRNYIRVEK